MAWVAPERRLVGGAVTDGVPVLGVCFGGQLLAEVLGGTVARAARTEIGWRLLDTDDPAVVPAGPWLDWHEDAFTCPPGARAVARTDVSLHAFVQGPWTGLQFHPEVTRPVVEGWIGDARERAHLSDEYVDALLEGFDPSGRGPLAEGNTDTDYVRRLRRMADGTYVVFKQPPWDRYQDKAEHYQAKMSHTLPGVPNVTGNLLSTSKGNLPIEQIEDLVLPSPLHATSGCKKNAISSSN